MQGDRNGDVPSNGISAIRVKDKGVPIGPGMAVTAYGEELLTLRCPPHSWEIREFLCPWVSGHVARHII